jgi:glycosyltransferase involved in cell wall biosynthesis
LARVKTRVIVSQHNALSAERARRKGFQFWILPYVSRLFLGKASGIIAVSQGVADDMAEITGIPRDRITVIYNPVVLDTFDQSMNESVSHPWLDGNGPPIIIGVGRFVAQKHFSLLIDAFAKVAQQTDVRLILLGDGPLFASLKAQAEKLGIADRLSMPGYTTNPLPFIRRAAVLALPSRFEGFSNVLVEALACGTPVVSTDCPVGPSEVLAGGKYGRLVPVDDPAAMADALLATLAHPASVQLLRERGREFTVAKATRLYLKLFYQVQPTLQLYSHNMEEEDSAHQYDPYPREGA